MHDTILVRDNILAFKIIMIAGQNFKSISLDPTSKEEGIVCEMLQASSIKLRNLDSH